MKRTAGRNRNLWLFTALAAASATAPGAYAADAPPPPVPPAPHPATLLDEVRAIKSIDIAGDPQAALTRIEAVLARARKDKTIPRHDLLIAEATRAGALFWLDKTAEALDIYRAIDAELLRSHAPMDSDWGQVINNIGAVLTEQGKHAEAMAYKERALDIAAQLTGKDSLEYANALYGVALIQYRLGRPLDAIPRVTEAIRITRAIALQSTGQPIEEPAIYGMSLSALLIQAGDVASSVDEARKAASYAEHNLGPSSRVTMAALNQLGAALNDSGRYAEAIPVLRRSLEARLKAYPPGHNQLAYSYNALGFALLKAGMPNDSLPFFEKAAEIFEKSPSAAEPLSLATVLGQIAEIARVNNDSARAIALREKAADYAHAKSPTPEHPDLLRAEINLAAEYISAHRLDEAEKLLGHANTALTERALPTNLLRIGGLMQAARLTAERGDTADAVRQAAAALSAPRARLLDRATPRMELATIAGQYHPYFVLLARLSGATNHPEQAFEALQLANVGDLQGAFSTRAGLRAASGEQAVDAVRAYQSLAIDAARLRLAINKAVGASDKARLTALEADLATLDARLREADGQLARLIPGYAALTAVEPVELARAQTSLGAKQGLLLYGQDGDGLVVIGVTAKRTAIGHSALSSSALNALIKRVRASIDDGLLDGGNAAYDRKAAYDLYRALFPQPVHDLLTETRELDVLATGSLAAVPFSALVTAPPKGRDDEPAALRATHWLAATHAVRMAISLDGSGNDSGGTPREASFTGIGAPDLGPTQPAGTRGAALLRSGETGLSALRELGSLPNAARELAAMAEHFPGRNHLLTGNAATEAAVRAAPLEQSRVIAFATHGLVGGMFRNVVEPALVLTPPAQARGDDDGLLTASEVARLKLDADWVILSACDTSAGEGDAGPTYSGLARSFVVAGARALLLSHWPVRDDVAATMTLSTLSATAKGMSRAEALRQAQFAILKDRRITGGAHPATWAPFVVVGK